MYPISEAFQRVLDGRVGRNRTISWWGTIKLTDGTTYNFDADDIVQGSGVLTSSCELPGVGGAYSTEFQAQFYTPIDPRRLKGAEIALYVHLIATSETGDTWGDIADFNWGDLASTKWGDTVRSIYTDIPMGLFYVTDANRAINSIKITAFDKMLSFDKALGSMDSTARTPYNWLRWMCTACGVTLGMTNDEVRALSNGSRNFTYADIDSNIKTYRDLLSQLATVLCSIAVIDRTGKLILVQHGMATVAEITPDNRFSSEFADYQSYYTGLYAQYKAKATQEYFKNVGTLDDDGLIVDIGSNVFLQISNTSNRKAAAQAIIDTLRNRRFTPFRVTVPFNPAFDLLDALAFSGGHTPANSYAPITTLVRRIGGVMEMECATPEEQQNPVRETIQVDGLSGGGGSSGFSYASSDFWILQTAFPDKDTIVSDDMLTTELTVNCTVDKTTLQIAWTGAYTLDEDATVTAKILLDGESIYEVADEQTAGSHVLTVTTGYEINTQGEHSIKVILREDVKEEPEP